MFLTCAGLAGSSEVVGSSRPIGSSGDGSFGQDGSFGKNGRLSQDGNFGEGGRFGQDGSFGECGKLSQDDFGEGGSCGQDPGYGGSSGQGGGSSEKRGGSSSVHLTSSGQDHISDRSPGQDSRTGSSGSPGSSVNCSLVPEVGRSSVSGLTCSHCGVRGIASISKLLIHSDRMHSKPFTCVICKVEFVDRYFSHGPLVKRVVVNRWQFSFFTFTFRRHLLDQSEKSR